MRVLFDTNVILDILLDREPFALPAAVLLSKAENSNITGYASATTVTTIFYLCRKSVGKTKATRYLQTLLSILEVAAVNRTVIDSALDCRIDDFEDAVISESAVLVAADAIVTRNKKDFLKSPVPVYTPAELIDILDSGSMP